MIVRERRRYFPCSLKIEVSVWSSAAGDVQAETIDITEDGMAVRLPYGLGIGTELLLKFKLPTHTKELLARAKIIRNGDAGLAALNFVDLAAQTKGQLHE
jgi:hypothetical protein